jgi:hypothetical protein
MGIARAFDGIKRSAKDAADPTAWARELPLASVGAALALGVLAGFATGRRSNNKRDRAAANKEPIVVEGRFRGVGRPGERRKRSLTSAASVGARWAARSFLRSFMPA